MEVEEEKKALDASPISQSNKQDATGLPLSGRFFWQFVVLIFLIWFMFSWFLFVLVFACYVPVFFLFSGTGIAFVTFFNKLVFVVHVQKISIHEGDCPE